MLKNICATLFLLCLLVPRAGWSQQASKDSTRAKTFVLGTIEEIQSRVLAEKRIVNIYLPEEYHKNDTVRYPVVYLLDGSADEDFIHIAGLYQFYSFPWIRYVPPSIVVGIANVNRQRDFTYPTSIQADRTQYPSTGHSEKFIDFVEQELQPFITKSYRTNASKTIIGQSLGGLLATEILLTRPWLFNNYIIVSPSLWWDNGSLLQKPLGVLRADYSTKKRVYVGVGKEGLVPGKSRRVMEADAKQLSNKIRSVSGVKVCFDYLPTENHATILHPAVANALRFLHGKEPLHQ